MLRTSDFDYYLPPELIAQKPADKRDSSRLMILDRRAQSIEHKYFYNIIDYLNSGDLLVLNDTKVIPANLVGRKENGGARVEVLLVSRKQKAERDEQKAENRNQSWECLVKPGKRLKIGSRVIFGKDEVIGKVIEKTENGEQMIEFEGDLEGFMKKYGEVPLPPYIKMSNVQCLPAGKAGPMSNEGNEPEFDIRSRYQTVYAKREGASAAPTAGLHFTKELLEKIKGRGVKVAYVTLHTGLATFKPVYAEYVQDHKMYSEYFEIPKKTIAAVKDAGRVVAVGTTTVRTLESVATRIKTTTKTLRPASVKTSAGKHEGHKGETNLFIYPSYKFKIVDAVITNFHWPRSTLIMLVSAFSGRDFILRAYEEAIQEKYRFYSFGDAMLIL